MAGYVPRARLDRTTIAPVGTGGGKGVRSVASYDEDTTTMGVEAARLALRSAPGDIRPDALWFSTVTPAYLDKTNATAIHAALRLDDDVAALDMVARRSAVGALGVALAAPGSTLVVSADVRTGLPGSGDEAAGGDAAAAVLVGDGGPGHRRAPGRGHRDRGVRRPVAHAGRRPLEAVGGALRRDQVPRRSATRRGARR